MRARLIFVFLALVALAFPALAEDRRGGGSLDRVLPEIRRTVPGTFSDAEGPFLSPDGRATYHVKWMTPDGRIIWFTVDARSGQVLGGAPAQQSRPRSQDEGNSGWGGHRNNFGSDDRQGWGGNSDRWGNNRGNGGLGNDRDGGGWANDRGGGGWGNNTGGDRGNDRSGWGNGRGGDRGSWGNSHDRGGWGNDRGGRGDRGGDDRGGHDRRHGG